MCYTRLVVQCRDLTAKNWLVLTGAHDLLALESHRVAHTVAKVFLHPDFNLDTFDSDVALLRLNTPVTWSSTVSPVCLPPPDYEFQSTTQCVITGWGVAGQTSSSHTTTASDACFISSFLPHDAMLARYMLSSCVCLFVLSSITGLYCTRMDKHRITETTLSTAQGL